MLFEIQVYQGVLYFMWSLECNSHKDISSAQPETGSALSCKALEKEAPSVEAFELTTLSTRRVGSVLGVAEQNAAGVPFVAANSFPRPTGKLPYKLTDPLFPVSSR